MYKCKSILPTTFHFSINSITAAAALFSICLDEEMTCELSTTQLSLYMCADGLKASPDHFLSSSHNYLIAIKIVLAYKCPNFIRTEDRHQIT